MWWQLLRSLVYGADYTLYMRFEGLNVAAAHTKGPCVCCSNCQQNGYVSSLCPEIMFYYTEVVMICVKLIYLCLESGSGPGLPTCGPGTPGGPQRWPRGFSLRYDPKISYLTLIQIFTQTNSLIIFVIKVNVSTRGRKKWICPVCWCVKWEV